MGTAASRATPSALNSFGAPIPPGLGAGLGSRFTALADAVKPVNLYRSMKLPGNAFATLCCLLLPAMAQGNDPAMHWADASSGRPFSKDPSVIRFGETYLMYYSLPAERGWTLGIACSTNLVHWEKVGVVSPGAGCEQRGIAAPAAWVRKGRVHLFYQTYGNGPKDAICHAWSDDGLHFTRNPENPVFAPTGSWTSGRAIDAEVFPVGDRLFLWFATRDPAMKVQMQGVAAAPLDSDYGRAQWRQLVDGPVLKPELPWERNCIEAASVMKRDGRLWMFYAGGYNNEPQQIGVASSEDGIHWKRVSHQPLVPNGPPGSWNSSESGHPGVFVDADGTTHLFYQGNNDGGKTWYLSKLRIEWKDGLPVVAK
jgi:beta-1,2-mannobiose phosphorylase / 1,2-beta-oligomannan phosphorylase